MIDIGQTVGQRKGQLLHSSRARLADMVAADADGVPARHVARAELDGIRHQAHRWFWREEKLFLRDILFENIILQRAAQFGTWKAIFLSVDDIHGPDYRSRAIDRHRGRDFVERQILVEDLHIGQGRDGHAAFAELARSHRVVGIVAVERGHIKGCRKASLTL